MIFEIYILHVALDGDDRLFLKVISGHSSSSSCPAGFSLMLHFRLYERKGPILLYSGLVWAGKQAITTKITKTRTYRFTTKSQNQLEWTECRSVRIKCVEFQFERCYTARLCVLHATKLCSVLYLFLCACLLTQCLSVITHQCVLSLFDKEGLSILSQLHVQTHWLSVDLYVHLQDRIYYVLNLISMY